jgi:hypothetical protein
MAVTHVFLAGQAIMPFLRSQCDEIVAQSAFTAAINFAAASLQCEPARTIPAQLR